VAAPIARKLMDQYLIGKAGPALKVSVPEGGDAD